MKKLLFLSLVLLFFSAAVFAQEESSELDASSLEEVQFVNYTGPNDVIDSAAAIKAIGTELGVQIVQNSFAFYGNKDRYSVVHAVSPKEDDDTEKLSADIFFIGKAASVDHITNLRRIIGGYLEAAYSYPTEEADTLAVYLTAYNAIYRGQLEVFEAKYKDIVIQNLTKENVGLSRSYVIWPGHTQIVIPLKKVTQNEDVSYLVDTYFFNDSKVIAYVNETEEEPKENIKIDLIRYKGLAFGPYFKADFATGKWQKYISSAIGGGLSAEYTFPLNLTIFDFGVTLKSDAEVYIPKNNLVKSGFDITVSAGAFIRLPFALGNLTAAFEPELLYGMVFHNLKTEELENVASLYTDQFLCLSAGLRLTIPKLELLEAEVAPQFTLTMENSNVILEPGLRIGAIWHLATK